MSQGEPLPLADAESVAADLVDLFRDSCTRIEVAGSIRRGKAFVGDIEIVVIPKIVETWVKTGGMFDEELPASHAIHLNVLEHTIERLRMDAALTLRDVTINRKDGTVETGHRNGPAYKALVYAGMPVDLFITDAERWGCIFALRTGPGDWNERLVTDCQRIFRSVADGRVLHLGKPVPTPEEADFFRALGQPWVEPWERHPTRVKIDGAIANAVPG